MKIQHVAPEWTARVWPEATPFIADALVHAGGDYTVEQAQTLVNTGQWVLVVAHQDGKLAGAATVCFINRPAQRVAFVTAIGGRLISNKDTYQQLSELLKSFGATHIEGAARESIARLWTRYGLAEKYRIVGAAL